MNAYNYYNKIRSLNIGENHFTAGIIASKLKEIPCRGYGCLRHLELSKTDFNEKDLQTLSEYFKCFNKNL